MKADSEQANGTGQSNHVGQEFGRRVRAARERAGLTLEQLSQGSGVSRAMLSKVERGDKSPTLGVAMRIAGGLDLSLSSLIDVEGHLRASAIVRKGERPTFRDEQSGFERQVLSPITPGSAAELLFHHLPARTSTGELPPYPVGTEKHVIVREGLLTVTIGGLEVKLGEGDTLLFEPTVPFSFDNRSDEPCGYYLVVTRCP